MYQSDLCHLSRVIMYLIARQMNWHQRLIFYIKWLFTRKNNIANLASCGWHPDDPLVKLYLFCRYPYQFGGTVSEVDVAAVREKITIINRTVSNNKLLLILERLIRGLFFLEREKLPLNVVPEIKSISHRLWQDKDIDSPNLSKKELIRVLTTDVNYWNHLRDKFKSWNLDLSSYIPETIRSWPDQKTVKKYFPDWPISSCISSEEKVDLLSLTHIKKCSLKGANLMNVNFSFCILDNVEMKECYLNGSLFVGAHINSSSFESAFIENTDFSYARISDSSFKYAMNSTGAHGDAAFIQFVEPLRSVSFLNIIFNFPESLNYLRYFIRPIAFRMRRRGYFRSTEFKQCNFEHAKIRAADFQKADLRTCDFSKSDLVWSNLKDVYLGRETVFHKAILFRTIFNKTGIACLSKDSGLSSNTTKQMYIIDDLGVLKKNFSGINGLFHSVGFTVFILPYLLFLLSLLSYDKVARMLSVYHKLDGIVALEYKPIYKSLYLFLCEQGLWLVIFMIFYNVLRMYLVYQTKKYEEMEKINGYLLDFQFKDNRHMQIGHYVVKLLWYINIIVLSVHTYRFITSPVATRISTMF